MDMNITFDKRTIERAGRLASALWRRWRHRVLFTILIAILIGGGAVWYWSLYMFRWTEDQKAEYIRSKLQTVQFREGKFEEAVNLFGERHAGFESVSKDGKDIFKK